MTPQEATIEIGGITQLNEQDIQDLSACSGAQLRALMEGYVADGKLSDRSVWSKVVKILEQVEEYGPLALSIAEIAIKLI